MKYQFYVNFDHPDQTLRADLFLVYESTGKKVNMWIASFNVGQHVLIPSPAIRWQAQQVADTLNAATSGKFYLPNGHMEIDFATAGKLTLYPKETYDPDRFRPDFGADETMRVLNGN